VAETVLMHTELKLIRLSRLDDQLNEEIDFKKLNKDNIQLMILLNNTRDNCFPVSRIIRKVALVP
jgi:hypothetical protein